MSDQAQTYHDAQRVTKLGDVMRRTTRLNPHSALAMFSLSFRTVCEESHQPALNYRETYHKYGRSRLPLWGYSNPRAARRVWIDPIGELIFVSKDGTKRTEALFSLESLGTMYSWANSTSLHEQDEAIMAKARAVLDWLKGDELSSP